MRSNRRTDTGPERRLRSELHRRGRRFRKDYRIDVNGMRIQVDIAFPRARLAVFVDGCFWHRCPQHASDPVRNSEFWRRKLERNVERDDQVALVLGSIGWDVLRCWEHEAADQAANRVVAALRARADTWA